MSRLYNKISKIKKNYEFSCNIKEKIQLEGSFPFAIINFLPKILLTGVNSLISRFAWATRAALIYFMLYNVPIIGLIAAKDTKYAKANTQNFQSVFGFKANTMNLVDIGKNAILFSPIIVEILRKLPLFKEQMARYNEEQINYLKRAFTSLSIVVNTLRTYYNIFYNNTYFVRNFNYEYYRLYPEHLSYIFEPLIVLQFLTGAYFVYYLDKVVYCSGVLSLVSIGYLTQFFSKIISNLTVFADINNFQIIALLILTVSAALLEYLSLIKIYKERTHTRYSDIKIKPLKQDSLFLLSEALFTGTMIKDVLTNASILIDVIAYFIDTLFITLNRGCYSFRFYRHAWYNDFFLKQKNVSTYYVLEKWLISKELTYNEKKYFILQVLDVLVFDIGFYFIYRAIIDVNMNPENQIEQDKTYHLKIKNVSGSYDEQYNYYVKANNKIDRLAVKYLSAIILPLELTGILPQNLISAKEFIMNYGRIINVKNSLDYLDVNELPLPIKVIQPMFKIPDSDEER